MPQALPFAAAFVASNTAAAVGASVAAQATVALAASNIAASVGSLALTIGASYAIAKLTAPRPPRPSEGSIERRDDLAPRFFSYGKCKVSGPVLLLEVDDRKLLKITAFGTRELASMDLLFVDGNGGPLGAGDGNCDGFYSNWGDGSSDLGQVRTHLGQDGQAADTLLLADYGPAWTTDHRLRGIPYAFAQLDSGSGTDAPAKFQNAFPTGEPTFGCLGGVKVYDPRKDSTNGGSGSHRMTDKSTWEFSENQRLACLDWLTWVDGYGKSWDRIDWSTWVPQIAMADDDIPLKAGGTEKRYRIATIVGLDEPKGRVLRRIMDAGDQQLFATRDGLIGSRGGVWQAPSVTLDAGDILEGSFTHGVPLMDRVNQFQLEATLPSHNYSEVELKEWSNTTDPEFVAGVVRRAPLQLLQVPSNGQAQRLAKIYMAKKNPRWSGQVRTNFAGLNVIGESAINLAFPDLDEPAGSFNGAFWVNGKISFSADRTGVTFPVAAADPASYDWNAATEEQDAPPVPP